MRGISVIQLKTCGTKSATLQPQELLLVSWIVECPLPACRSRSFVPCQPSAAVVEVKSSTNYLPVSSLAVTLYVWLFLHLIVLLIGDQGWKLMGGGGCLWTRSGQPHSPGMCLSVWVCVTRECWRPSWPSGRWQANGVEGSWSTVSDRTETRGAWKRACCSTHAHGETHTHTHIYNYTRLGTHKYIHPHLHSFSSILSVSALYVAQNYCTRMLQTQKHIGSATLWALIARPSV